MTTVNSPNLNAFLDMIAFSELGPSILAESDNGYNVLVGSLPGRVKLFHSYVDHPRQLITLTLKRKRVDGVPVPVIIKSTAAGRYQILSRFFDAYRRQLNLPDFGYDSQDRIALQMIGECRALDHIDDGRFEVAARKCASRWASLPGAGYGQHENKMGDLLTAYVSAGGTLA